MSRRIPLFPLPGVVLLPGTLLPLHIFEPRYRAMVADALEGDRTIGMAMLKPGWESAEASPADPRGRRRGRDRRIRGARRRPLQHPAGGPFRYRILEEEPAATPYRTASVEEIASIPFGTRGGSARLPDGPGPLLRRSGSNSTFLRSPTEPFSRTARLGDRPAPALPAEELQALLETDSLVGALRRSHRPHAGVAARGSSSSRPSAQESWTPPETDRSARQLPFILSAAKDLPGTAESTGEILRRFAPQN